MDIKAIPKDVQKLICSHEEFFYGEMLCWTKRRSGTVTVAEVIDCSFIRETICHGYEQLSIVCGNDPVRRLFGFYDRKRNQVDYCISDLSQVDESLLFGIGPAGPKTDVAASRMALELVVPFLFFEDGSLNQEELEQLPVDFSKEQPVQKIMLRFASALYQDPAVSFQSLLFSHINFFLSDYPGVPSDRNDILPFWEIARLHFLEGEPNQQEDALQVIKTILCDSDGHIARSLYCIWISFLEAKDQIKNRTEACRAQMQEIEEAIKEECASIRGDISVCYGNDRVTLWPSNLLDAISPIGFFVDTWSNGDILWSQIDFIKQGRRVLWKRKK